jgi:hypothetical protein
MGFEPTTSSLGSWHSTTELLPLVFVSLQLLETKGLSPKSLHSIQSARSIQIYLVGPQNGQQNRQHGSLRRCRAAS